MLAHMLCNPKLLESVRRETDACVTPEGSCDLEKLLHQCPHLDAIWNEALRLYGVATTVRVPTQECHIGSIIIQSGSQIFAPARNFHMEYSIFGADPHNFNAERFLEDKTLSKSRGFVPFGGGQTYCPGRFFAQREAYMFLALTLKRFEVEVTTREGNVIQHPRPPSVEKGMPAAAVTRPADDMFVMLRERTTNLG